MARCRTLRPVTPRTPALLVLLALAAALLLAGCGDDSSSGGDEPAAKAKTTKFEGATADPPKPAPRLQLKDSTGKRFDIADFRGKAVLVTFLYVNCPDVCPLMTANLHTAVKQLGPKANDLQIVAVSTDPERDTPKAVNKYLKKHQVTSEMRYLVGSKAKLEPIWKAWGVISRPDPTDPKKVEHSAPIYGISASGKITTLYASNFRPPQVINDVPILAEQ